MNFASYNGDIFDATLPALPINNRGLKYGDGVFETARVLNGKILLEDFHFERLLTGLTTLRISYETAFQEKLLIAINKLCQKNSCSSSAKIRIAAFREDANGVGYLIEVTPLPDQYYQLNSQGWDIDIYPDAAKSCDVFANLKSANYLPYVMADLHAKANGLNECLVMNSKGFIADGSRTNIFSIKDKTIFTPALNQGCVAGVMRRFVIDQLKRAAYDVIETEVSVDLLLDADEVFLTNAIKGIQWAKKFREKVYASALTGKIFDTIFTTNA